MSTEEIFNYIKVDDDVITGGYPTAEQLRDAATEGYTTVINLAIDSPGFSLENEDGIVASLGMAYIHIPVMWNDPSDESFAAFEQAMQRLRGQKILVHCAANFRVTAFYSLYARKHLGWTEEQAQTLRAIIWTNDRYPVWEAFIGRQTVEIER